MLFYCGRKLIADSITNACGNVYHTLYKLPINYVGIEFKLNKINNIHLKVSERNKCNQVCLNVM